MTFVLQSIKSHARNYCDREHHDMKQLLYKYPRVNLFWVHWYICIAKSLANIKAIKSKHNVKSELKTFSSLNTSLPLTLIKKKHKIYIMVLKIHHCDHEIMKNLPFL